MIRVWYLSGVCLSVTYIGLQSRTERPRKTNIGIEVAHVTRDSDTTFKVKRSKVNLQGAGHIVAASRTACLGKFLAELTAIGLFVCIDVGLETTQDHFGLEGWSSTRSANDSHRQKATIFCLSCKHMMNSLWRQQLINISICVSLMMIDDSNTDRKGMKNAVVNPLIVGVLVMVLDHVVLLTLLFVCSTTSHT